VHANGQALIALMYPPHCLFKHHRQSRRRFDRPSSYSRCSFFFGGIPCSSSILVMRGMALRRAPYPAHFSVFWVKPSTSFAFYLRVTFVTSASAIRKRVNVAPMSIV